MSTAQHGQFYDHWEDKPLNGEDVLIDLMDQLNIDTPDESKIVIVKRITRTIYDLCHSPDSLNSLVSQLHAKSLEKELFGRKAACVLGSVSQLEVSGVKMRDVLLRSIQSDFKKREEMRNNCPDKLYKAVNLLCEIFKEVKLEDGAIISVLCVPILEYFQLLLDLATPAAIQLLGQQLQQLGQQLQVSQRDRVADLMMAVRKRLVKGNLSEEDKSILLRILELYLLRWPVLLPERVEDWYNSFHAIEENGKMVEKNEKITIESPHRKETIPPPQVKPMIPQSREAASPRRLDVRCPIDDQEKETMNMKQQPDDKEINAYQPSEKESVTSQKRNKIASGGIWGRALKELEAVDKSGSNGDKGVERVERLTSPGDRGYRNTRGNGGNYVRGSGFRGRGGGMSEGERGRGGVSMPEGEYKYRSGAFEDRARPKTNDREEDGIICTD